MKFRNDGCVQWKEVNMKYLYYLFFLLFACKSVQKSTVLTTVNQPFAQNIAKQLADSFLQTNILQNAHVGISIFDADNQTFLFEYQADKNFIPASNTKIFSCYAALSFLGDSTCTFYYQILPNGKTLLVPAGDPTFLHPQFTNGSAELQLKNKEVVIANRHWQSNSLGRGWAWDDYNADYMAERSMMPINGNVLNFTKKGTKLQIQPPIAINLSTDSLFANAILSRNIGDNTFYWEKSAETWKELSLPFYTIDTLFLNKLWKQYFAQAPSWNTEQLTVAGFQKFYNHSLDSALKWMMYESDNLFAEQCLQMVSMQLLGYMHTEKIIDTLLKSPIFNLSAKPKWVDGSGLSRYNLFTPNSFITVLKEMKRRFAW
ncbi:MAG: D-alanyl-D-alanine carboxypeptidase, partial [Chitinophagaceae bacterium]